MEDDGFGHMFKTNGVKSWESSDIPFLLRWFTVDIVSGQTIMAPNIDILMSEAVPAALNGKNVRDIQFIIAASEGNTNIISERLASMEIPTYMRF